MPLDIYISTDNEVTVTATYNGGVPVNNQTATAKITTKAGVALAGSEITLDYQAASDGEYKGTLIHNIAMADAVSYWLVIVVTDGTLQVTARVPFKAGYYNGS